MTKLSEVADTILADVEAGVLREGDRLPSEEKLAAKYRVSVGTIQKALSRLARTTYATNSSNSARSAMAATFRVKGTNGNYFARFRAKYEYLTRLS